MNRIIILFAVLLLLSIASLAQSPNAKHFDKDGLSFDYAADWQLSDQSNGQMQFLELSKGDVVMRIRSPREYLKSPDKEAHAKKLMQDQYVDNFAAQLSQAGMNPKRSVAVTQIAGGDAEGARVRAMLGGEPGGMDAYYRIISDRFVDLSIIGPEKEIASSAPAWDTLRTTLKIKPAENQPSKTTPTPKP